MNTKKLVKFYEEIVLMKGASAIAGEQEKFVKLKAVDVPDTPILQAFYNDADVQEITICSTNIGFVRNLPENPKGREA